MLASRPETPATGRLGDFLAELLAEQQRLQTPVARFAALHDFSPSAAQAFRSSLIPLTAPRAGEQYAFEVDLDVCTGCKACVSACHALNGLDETETWRDTGQLLGGCGGGAPITQTITSACHHCEDPGCLNGCPVLAYEKDPLTGIVRHLDDQCIGCQYCVLKCPYDVPKYNERLGIVRKCDLCHQRLAVGEAPACAQACPTQAIRIVVSRHAVERSASSLLALAAAPADARGPAAALGSVAVGKVGDHSEAAAPGESGIENPRSKISIPFPAFDPDYTRPTTRYVTTREFPRDVRAADSAVLRPQHPHWPLVLMLTLLPWAILLQATLGAAAVASANGTLAGTELNMPYYGSLSASAVGMIPLVLGALGLGAATLHLGQPLRAWRVFLGLRTSWFSREAVLFGAWFGATAALAGTAVVPPLEWARAALAWAAPALGLAGLACSVMIYVDTRRRFWRATFVAPRFFLGGGTLALAVIAPWAALTALALKLAVETASLVGDSPSARLQRGPFRAVVGLRLAGAAVAVALFTGDAWFGLSVLQFLGLLPLLAGEIAERYLFFRAVDAPKMPGYAAGEGGGHAA